MLRPTLARLAETVDPREVSALVGLVDRLPPLLDAVDRDVLPLLGHLNEMAPDLHALLEAVDDLRRPSPACRASACSSAAATRSSPTATRPSPPAAPAKAPPAPRS